MVKRIIWSLKAQADRKQILTYWNNRNKSANYSKKLNQRFKEALQAICKNPKIGKQTDDSKVRIKIVKDYLLIYEETEDAVILLTIWDSRQNPDKLDLD